MTMQDNAILLDRLTTALEAVNASLVDTSNPIGRDYHKRAIDALTKITTQLDEMMRAESAMAKAGASANEDAVEKASEVLLETTLRYEMGEYYTRAVNLGDYIFIDHATAEFKIFPYGSWMPVYDNMPVATRIADREMESLYDILDAIETDTGIQITAYHIEFRPTVRDE